MEANNSTDQKNMTFYTTRVGNVKFGTTKPGNPYIRLGLVIKQGPKKGQWLNYMMIITEKTKARVKKELELAGVTLGEGEEYSLDGRLVTAVWGYSDYWKEEQVLTIRPSLFQPDTTKPEAEEF